MQYHHMGAYTAIYVVTGLEKTFWIESFMDLLIIDLEENVAQYGLFL